jgi:hypothetical protein
MLLRETVSYFWKKVYRDPGFIGRLLDGQDLMNEQLVELVATFNAAISRQNIKSRRRWVWMPVVYFESDLNNSAIRFDDGDLFDSGLVFDQGDDGLGGFTLPIAAFVKDVAFVLSTPADSAAALQRKIDFKVLPDRGVVLFRQNPFLGPFQRVLAVKDGETEPESALLLWYHELELSYDDLQIIYGDPPGLGVEADDYHKRIVNAVWDLRQQGGTTCAVMELLSAVTDTSLPKSPGVVTRRFEEAGRKWIYNGSSDPAIFSAPSSAEYEVVEGDEYLACEPLFDSVRLFDAQDVLDPAEIPALALGEGFLGPGFPGGVIVENKEYPFPDERWLILADSGTGVLTVEDVTEADYTYLLDLIGGEDVYALVDDMSANYKLISYRYDLPFKGFDETVALFKDKLAGLASDHGGGIADTIIAANGGITPWRINMLAAYWEHSLSKNAFLVKIRTECVPTGVDPGPFISQLRITLPAHTMALAYMENETEDDHSVDPGESLELFKVVDAADAAASPTVVEDVLAETVI